MARPGAFEILPDLISKEPLAPLVRADDRDLWSVLRWTVFALMIAEELGISSENIDRMASSDNLEVRRLLGVAPGSGAALGLDDRWAYRAIRRVGNYGQVFERHLGLGSPVQLSRGLNRLWNAGGLLYPPPLR